MNYQTKLYITERNVSLGLQGVCDLKAVIDHGRVLPPANNARTLCMTLAYSAAKELDDSYDRKHKRRGA